MRRMAWGGIFLAAISTIGCGGGDSAPATSTTNASNKPAAGGGPVVQPPGGGGGAPAVQPPAGGGGPPVAGGAPSAGGPPAASNMGGGLPPPGGNPYGQSGGPGFGSPPPGTGGPPGVGGAPVAGGAPAAAVGGTPPNYLGMATAIGTATATAPLSFYDKAMLCFQQGKDEEAFKYLYADAVTGSVKAKSLQMKWSAALKRPVVAVRFGVAVNYSKPEKYTGSPLAIGTKFNEQGQPQGAGGAGPGMMAPPGGAGAGGGQQADPAPTDPVANFEYYTGDYGKKLMVKLDAAIRDGKFGAFYKEAAIYKAPTQVPLNLAAYMGGPPPAAATGAPGGYGAPGGGYGAPGGYGTGGGGGSPNPLGAGGSLPPAPGAATGGGSPLPPAPGAVNGGGSAPSTGGAGVGAILPRRGISGRQHILAQQQDDGLSTGAPQVGGKGAPAAPGAGGPGLPGSGMGPGGMGPGGMFGQQNNNAAKPVTGVKYYGTGSQAEIVEKAKADGIDVLLFFTVKVSPPNRLGRDADNTTTCRAINVHDGSSLFETGRGITARKAAEKPESVDAAVDGVFGWFTDGATGAKGPIGKLVVDEMPAAVNAETVKGRVQKLSTPGGEGLEVMHRLAELRFYNARRILPLTDLKAAYEAILGAEKGAKLAMGSTNDKRAVIDAWNAKFEPILTSAPAAPANQFGGGMGTGGYGGPPGGVGGPPPGYGGPGGYGPGSPGPGSSPPGPPGSSPPPGGSSPPGGGFGAPPPGVGGPPGGVGGNPGFPGGKGAGS